MSADKAAGLLSLAAALVHGGLAPEHFEEWWGYGLFFLAVTTAQALLGLALLLDAFDAPRQVRGLRWLGIGGNLLVAATYVLSRTVGIPLVGPSPGTPEPVDALGVLTLLAELAVVALLARELTRAPRAAGAPSS